LNIAPHHEGLTTGAQGAEAVDAGFLECSFRLFRSASEPELIAYDLAIVHIHFFNPLGVGDWWITEGSTEGDDFIMFGLCDLGFPELGYVSLNELESVQVIERNPHWIAKPLRDVRHGR